MMYQLLLFGEKNSVRDLSRFLGVDRHSQKAMFYFEFPNKKFDHPKIVKNFPERIKWIALQPALLKTMLAPKREFEAANALVWVFDWDNQDSLKEGFEYLRKFATNRKSFLPLLLIGVHRKQLIIKDNNETKSLEKYSQLFLNYWKESRKFSELLEIPVHYVEFNPNRKAGEFIAHLKFFINNVFKSFDKSQIFTSVRRSTIIIEKMLKDIELQIQTLQQQTKSLDNLLVDLILHEIETQTPLCRYSLQKIFGCEPEIAIFLMNLWNKRESFEINDNNKQILEDKIVSLQSTLNMYYFRMNLPLLLNYGFGLREAKEILQYLYQTKRIFTISHHIESEDYLEFQNIRELIILHDGRTLFVKSTNKNIDQTLQFSDMIQALEMVRDQYLQKVAEQDYLDKKFTSESAKGIKIEFLEFGNLKAIIAHGVKGVKIILRLNERPLNELEFRKRIKNFLIQYENQIPLLPTIDAEEQQKIRSESEKIFYRHFNPFPLSVDVFKPLFISKSYSRKTHPLTDIELKLVDIIKSNPDCLLEDVLQKWADQFGLMFSRSDLLLALNALIRNKIIRFANGS